MDKARYDIGLKMTRLQTMLGWLYLPFFAVLNVRCILLLARLFRLSVDDYTLNLVYMTVNLVFVLLAYHRFLIKSFRGFTEHFWLFIQTLILGFAMYYVLGLLTVFPLSLSGETTANNRMVTALLAENKAVMLFFTLLAGPVVEEVLFRGVVFGSLHKRGRILAYAVSALLFALVHTWQYAASMDVLQLLIQCAVYAAPGIALGWTYEKSGTILCPLLLHVIINAMACGVSLTF